MMTISAIADNLRDASRRAPSNAMFGLLSLQDAPGDLAALADRLTVLFPWGPLLGRRRPAGAGLAGTAAGPLQAGRGSPHRVPARLSDGGARERLREAGLAMSERQMSVEEVRALPTTWPRSSAIRAGRANSAPSRAAWSRKSGSSSRRRWLLQRGWNRRGNRGANLGLAWPGVVLEPVQRAGDAQQIASGVEIDRDQVGEAPALPLAEARARERKS